MLDEDDGARIGVWVTLGIVTLLLFGLIFGLGWRTMKHKAQGGPAVKAATMAAPMMGTAAVSSTASAADAVVDVPLSGDLVGKVYFDLGSADLPADVAQPLGDALAAVNADSNKKLMLSGFHDPSGDPAKNAELAKSRAKAVREALAARGVAADRIVLRKPEQTSADGPAADARRVEIRLVTSP
jgi:outer membrane protein OmpA-like peptidoglycan-associated protein